MNAPAGKLARRASKRPNETAAAEAQASAADHQVMIALAAYFIAQKRGFEPGHELDDWLAAEAEIAGASSPAWSNRSN